jgi:hypothetical protein
MIGYVSHIRPVIILMGHTGLGYLAASTDRRRVSAALPDNTAASQHPIAVSVLATAASSIAIAAYRR